MPHDPGLAASPLARYILEVEGIEHSLFQLSSTVDGYRLYPNSRDHQRRLRTRTRVRPILPKMNPSI